MTTTEVSMMLAYEKKVAVAVAEERARIATVMGCEPMDGDDLVEAVRLLVAERDAAEAECARLRADLDEATPRLEAYGTIAHLVVGYDAAPIEDVVLAATELPFVRLERNAARAEADALREAVVAERARCAAVCRGVSQFYDSPDIGSVVALACADSIERGEVTP